MNISFSVQQANRLQKEVFEILENLKLTLFGEHARLRFDMKNAIEAEQGPCLRIETHNGQDGIQCWTNGETGNVWIHWPENSVEVTNISELDESFAWKIVAALLYLATKKSTSRHDKFVVENILI